MLFKIGKLYSIFPVSFCSILLIIWPLLDIIALVPLLADLIKNELFSIDLKTAFAKCCGGPIEFPNQASSDILIIRFVF